MTPTDDCPPAEQRWLFLIHQLPAQPAYLRVKVWRRLQALGAVAVKNSVYALPEGERAREDFQWLLREITAGGGEAFVCEARLVSGLTNRQVRALFDGARDTDYEDIAKQARDLASASDKGPSAERRVEARTQLVRLKARFAQIIAVDFFDADGRQAAESLLADLDDRLHEAEPDQPALSAAENDLGALHGRTWVTREGVHVDRIASAWLIRRFVDPDAAFRFVPAKGYAPAPGELRFDMFGGEFTHEGDRCTFEVLLERAGPAGDPALRAIAEMIHDLDLKDDKFARPETAGLHALIEGLCVAIAGDGERLVRGAAVLDDLHTFFGRRRP
jgi:hypothetical protein